MAQKAITIYTPESQEPHIFAEDDAQVYRAVFGGSGITEADEKLACTIVDNNTVMVASGLYSNQGYLLSIPGGESITLTIGSGTAGMYRRDLVISEFSRGGGDTPDAHVFKVLQGVEGAADDDSLRPALQQDDLRTGGSFRQESLYEVKISGITITSVIRMANYVGSYYA